MLWWLLCLGIVFVLVKLFVPTEEERKAGKKNDKMTRALQDMGVEPTYIRQMHDGSWRLAFDDKTKTMYYVTPGFDENSCCIIPFKYENIVSYELDSDDGTIVSENTAGKAIGRAAIGGVLAGGVGAAIGGATTKTSVNTYHNKYNLIVHFKDSKVPKITLRCIEMGGPFSEDSINYQLAVKGAEMYMASLNDAMMKGSIEE